ncbi:winged helix DNA-binding domain-containing protein [Hymenobacter weizhouensis]|uniref:winged helix DNA-binding domain-containing protein n=1 Tax=Hymenobacter sp. YIM 151500-1 TaxID=2987689 RepID=UPI00222704FC|nr:winged helix DNA-binding domain-containing protein [Hymenobacter sp. YIM 151500-1]UYZ64699.1 winged helix DNA-binding domain-containing protein [Hymenobacter sp. YIM 151500-1]
MLTSDQLLAQRLQNQQVAASHCTQPAEVAARLGGLQAQEYTQVGWAFGVRLPGAQAADIEHAFAAGTIVRTWLLRGTLHVAAAEDVRWLLALLAPRLVRMAATVNTQRELDEAMLRRSQDIVSRALEGRRHLTRGELTAALAQAGIAATGPRLASILLRAALDQVICLGPRRGLEATFVLLDEWVPGSRPRPREEALAELARRYFISHGPATVPDFAWWAGLTLGEARAGLAAVQTALQHARLNGQEYWFPAVSAAPTAPKAYLLPGFDEYFLGYKDRTLLLDAAYIRRVASSNGIFSPLIVVDGRVVGIWKRTVKKEAVVVELQPFQPLGVTEQEAIALAAEQYGQFLAKKPQVLTAAGV